MCELGNARHSCGRSPVGNGTFVSQLSLLEEVSLSKLPLNIYNPFIMGKYMSARLNDKLCEAYHRYFLSLLQ